jgi:LmbE family N-acetylglucosaminyl deacetylase
MNKREIFQAVIDNDKAAADTKGIIVEAHPDDAALAEAIDIKLARKGVGITIVTFTDGSARRLDGFNPRQLALKRREESILSAKKSEAARVIHVGYPDSQLEQYQGDATEVFSEILKSIQPDFIIAPHRFDPHEDHSSANKIAKAAGGDLPFYSMDTITMKDTYGEAIIPTHYFYVSAEEKQIRDEAYLLHESQVRGLPLHQMKDVESVLTLPQRRGEKVGLQYAGILVQESDGKFGDPIADRLQNDIIRLI